MDDFFKTKVGFTVGLLAAIFAIKPLIDANQDFGFIIANIEITVEQAYLFSTALLGLAVYFISLQFASSKHVSVLDKLSNFCYSAALIVPILFLVLWAASKLIPVISKYSHAIPEYVIGVILGVASSILGSVISNVLFKGIRDKFQSAQRAEEQKQEVETLKRAKELYDSGMYDLSVLDASKVIESTIRRMLADRGVDSAKVNMHKLIEQSKEAKLLPEKYAQLLHEIRVKRNQSVHLEDAVTENDAKRVLSLSQELLLKLDLREGTTGTSAFTWLSKNQSNVLSIFKSRDIKKSYKPLAQLKQAWLNRDGAVWIELGVFFESALTYVPEAIVTHFAEDAEYFESWLQQAEAQLFTDFLGNTQRLQESKKLMLQSMRNVKSNDSKENKVIDEIIDMLVNAKIHTVQ
ncbi:MULTISPECIES: DUF4145 domain-containing protein [Vibrio]|uniref:DUF4145 domain-containing protein n=1 Tax=Vibrio TaxID=662 RepID=UPI000CD0F76C|nr:MULTISPECIES: DUF4145 domain-containing protein [Vibrio]EHU4934789.1 DUF4145 domain-containing protein [Vibrio vulnificus]EHZ2652267.1 DUF4145 domain-containing protein [Vibrio vulnificus]EIX4880781.1 DUF4145 domain-containing protein [Vibrio vulnificus]EIZ1460357.1 DUF4145 domain-containing protein [Vibrio vulnificus]EJE8572349.1 DUF4145 domain-containing protein [Vibrio vulnificus]